MSITLQEPGRIVPDRMDTAIREIAMVADTLAMAGQARFGYDYLARGLDEIGLTRSPLVAADDACQLRRVELDRFAERWHLVR